MNRRTVKVFVSTLACVAALAGILMADGDDDDQDSPFARVLLLSVDGLHASDLEWYVATHADSTLAQLSATGRTYTNASASKPSDSFPGLLAMVTGGTPRSTGVFYDDSYDRSLLPAAALPAPDPSCAPPFGTRVQWKQNLDVLPLSFITTIDPLKLPRDPADGCTSRVYPHQFPRVNNVFELVKAAGGRTAWSDKHPAYEFLNGPSGTGVDDLYTPEIQTLTAGLVTTNSFALTMAYDDMKVAAIVNEIKGFDHTGTTYVGTPTVFGMNFQAVSVGQKLKAEQLVTDPPSTLVGGYGKIVNPDGTFTFPPLSGLQAALEHTNQSIGMMVSALRDQGLLDSTLIIISAKHGNSPIDPTMLVKVDPQWINNIVNCGSPAVDCTKLVPPVSPTVALVSADTGPLIWLKDSTKMADAVAALHQNRAVLNLLPDDPLTDGDEAILSGSDVFGVPSGDSRLPDIVLLPKPGTVYTTSKTKIADHGSFYPDDVHVALLVSNPRIAPKTIEDLVETRQIACTILKAVALDCGGLGSEQTEPSKFLPHSNHPNTH